MFAGEATAGLTATTVALDTARLLGYAEGQAYALWHRAEALAALQRPGESLDDATESLSIATAVGHRGWTATGWRASGIAHQCAGDLDSALHCFRRSLELSEHLDLFACWAAARAASVLVALGRLEEAQPLVYEALATGPPLGRYEARLAQVELAAARWEERTPALAAAALAQADAGGVVQGRANLLARASWR